MIQIAYTAVTTGFDKVRNPHSKFNGECLAFVENGVEVGDEWEVRELRDFSTLTYPERRNAKPYKMLPHLFLPKHDISLWVDGNLAPNCQDIDKLLGDADIGVFKHDRCKPTVREEAHAAAQYEDNDLLQAQMDAYGKDGFPDKCGLWICSTIIRRNNSSVSRFNQMWYEQVCKYSSRDQVSFPYCMWKSKVVVKSLGSWPGFDSLVQKDGGHL